TQATLVFRLVNNDRDTHSTVRIRSQPDDPPMASVGLLHDTAPEGPGTEQYHFDRLTNDPTVTGTATDDLGVVLLQAQVDAGAFQAITSTLQNSAYTWNPGTLPPGPHRITVRATDTIGQTHDAVLDFVVNTPPVANAGGPHTVNEGTVVSF